MRWRKIGMDSTRPYQPWAEAVQMAAKSPRVLEAALQTYADWSADSNVSLVFPDRVDNGGSGRWADNRRYGPG